MSKPDALAKRCITVIERRPDDLAVSDTSSSQLKQQAAVAVLGLLVEGGRVFLHAQRQRVDSDAAWEDTHRQIALLDADTQSKLRLMEGEMASRRDKTERLGVVLAQYRELRRCDEPPDSFMSQALASVLDKTDWG